jgi:hypothetical protein
VWKVYRDRVKCGRYIGIGSSMEGIEIGSSVEGIWIETSVEGIGIGTNGFHT